MSSQIAPWFGYVIQESYLQSSKKDSASITPGLIQSENGPKKTRPTKQSDKIQLTLERLCMHFNHHNVM